MGKKIYVQTCLFCHGVNGKADTDMKFIVKPRDLSKTILNEEQSYQVIKHGAHYWGASADIMPSFKSVYNEKELASVSYYVSKTFNHDVEKKIQKLYAQSDDIPNDKISKMLKRGKRFIKEIVVGVMV
jgi:mono/diheme cytochrome c family protein